MTLDYLSVVCGWNLKQMVTSFPLGILQLLRFLCLFKILFLFLAAYSFSLICVICVGRSSRVYQLRDTGLTPDACWHYLLLCEQQEQPAFIFELSQCNQKLTNLLQSQPATNWCWLSYFITLGENVVEALKQYSPSQAPFCWIFQLHSSKWLCQKLTPGTGWAPVKSPVTGPISFMCRKQLLD